MTTDDQITADLALVGRASRARPLPLADTLRAVSTTPLPDGGPADLSTLPMARVFATRVARIAVSIQILAFIAVALVSLTTQHEAGDEGLWIALAHSTPYDLALWTLACATLVHVVAWQLAATRFERSLAVAVEPLDRGAKIVQRVDGWSIALVIAAAMALTLTVGVLYIVAGPRHLDDLRRFDAAPWLASLRTWMLWGLYLSVGASLVAAVVITRLLPRAWTPRSWVVAVALAGLAITIYVGLREDVGPMTATIHHTSSGGDVHPDLALRTTLLVTGTLSLFTLVASYVLARRRREDRAIRG